MTDPEPIPLSEFTAALESLDRAAFASFVGELRAVTADDVDVEAPLVTVRTGETRTELLVGPPESAPGIDPAEVDGVVTRVEELPNDDVDATLVTPSDLRQRLLWALRVDDAQSLCERTLGVPAYSPRYASTPASTETAASEPPQHESRSGRAGRPVVLLSLIALVVLAAGAGVVYLTDPGDSVTALLGGGDDATDDTPPDAESLAEPGAGDDSANATAVETTDLASESRRTVGLEPTCNRSFLHVVQIQMNALKYNDNATNDGIRTVRQFASPENRRAVGSVRSYARLIRGGSYAPMLSYDSVRYTPQRLDEDTARVEVVTFENSTETGQYEFRLSKSRSDTERYDGCWMTDGVSVVQEGTDG